jgi:pimeloyl-ACP methyl ester carboxylesterase
MSAIVMVHGAFCGGWAFERFRGPFEKKGWRVLTPDLRGHAVDDPAERVVGLSMTDYADDVVALCEREETPPILVGHSMGGLVAQMAAVRTPVRALVLLAPSATWGVQGFSMEEAVTAFGVQMMTPFFNGAVEPDVSLMRHYSLDRMPERQAAAIIDRLRPESARALRETLNWWLDPFMTTSLGVGPLTAPSLVLTGERDSVHPVATVRQTAARIGAELRVMPGMSHWLIGEPGWADVASELLAWLAAEARAAA